MTQSPDFVKWTAATEATGRALKMAGISLEDVDFAEIYDCFTISVLLQTEDIGFCKKGEGGAFMEEGHNALGGSLPVNTHGGNLSHGYVMGVSHVIEAVRQLRHEAGAAQVGGAEIGLVGGMGLNEYGTLILRRS
ncbi:MAG: thiolase family protein [Dehalococcoidia bacterium]